MLILSFFDGSLFRVLRNHFAYLQLTCCVVQRNLGPLSVKEKQQITDNMLEDLPNELLENIAEWVRICLRSLGTLLTPLVTTPCSSIPEPRLLDALPCSAPSDLPGGRVSCCE